MYPVIPLSLPLGEMCNRCVLPLIVPGLHATGEERKKKTDKEDERERERKINIGNQNDACYWQNISGPGHKKERITPDAPTSSSSSNNRSYVAASGPWGQGGRVHQLSGGGWTGESAREGVRKGARESQGRVYPRWHSGRKDSASGTMRIILDGRATLATGTLSWPSRHHLSACCWLLGFDSSQWIKLLIYFIVLLVYNQLAPPIPFLRYLSGNQHFISYPNSSSTYHHNHLNLEDPLDLYTLLVPWLRWSSFPEALYFQIRFFYSHLTWSPNSRYRSGVGQVLFNFREPSQSLKLN